MTADFNTPVSLNVATFPVVAFDIRYFVENEISWWVAADAAKILDIEKNFRNNIAKFPADEKGVYFVHTPGGPQKMLCVNEPGLYRLIFMSRKPEAEKFKHWIFHEVLPSIRKNGYYAMPTAEKKIDFEKNFLRAFRYLKDCIDLDELSLSEQLIILEWLRIYYFEHLNTLEISINDLAKKIGKSPVVVNNAVIKLAQKRLLHTLDDILYEN